MADYQFYHPIEIRYGDLDPQGHVNNARYLTFFEQARVEYARRLGIWQGGSFLNFPTILAEMRITYLAPVFYGQAVRVGVRVTRLGNKSLIMDYTLEDVDSGKELANGSSVLVAYDYHHACTIPIPEEWRQKIREYEGI